MLHFVRNAIRPYAIIFFFIVTIGLLRTQAAPTGWQHPTLEEITIAWEKDKMRLEEALNYIEEKTDFKFFYASSDVPLQEEITVKDKANLKVILSAIARQRHLEFKRIGLQIVVRKSKVNRVTEEEQISLERIITGRITDQKTGELLIGATVLLKGTLLGAVTDAQGMYKLVVPEGNQLLVFSYIGYEKTEVNLADKQLILDVTLSATFSSLNEVVVIGYGTTNKENLTGAVAQIKSDRLKDMPNVGFEQNLVGQLPGVNIQQTTGTPGGNVSIKIRGTGSISAGNDPLIIIDGFPVSDSYNTSTMQGSRPSNATRRENPQNSLNTLNPNDIASIEVLKDASATAIYGSRGSNGVVLITTKRGAEGKPSFSLNSYYGIQEITKTYDMMDAYTFAEQNYLARVNAGTVAGFPQALVPYLNDQPGLPNTNWQDALFRSAPIQNYDLAASGGNKTLKYFTSANFFNQEGIIIGSGFDRYSIRTNLDAQLTDKLKLGVNINPSLTQSDLVPAENPYFVDGVVNLALLSLPSESIYNPDGSYNFSQNTYSSSGPFVNPIALANGVKDDLQQFRFLGGINLEYSIIDGLTFKTSLGTDINNFRRSYYRPSWIPVRGAQAPSNPEGRNYSTQAFNWINENTLHFDKVWNNDNHLDVLAGYTAQKERVDRNGLVATNFPNDLVPTLNAGQVTSGFSQITEWSLLSYLARTSYDYQGKYLLQATIRRDGSSRFGQNSKWGWFPSASLGWRVSSEKFYPIKNVINDLKFRASYGQTGNFSIPNYGSVALLEAAKYVLDGTVVNGLAPDTSPNADLSWEKTTMLNVGLDMGILEDRFTINADYFISNTSDLLINLPVPGSSGFSTSLQNIGEVQNKGFELGITAKMNVGELNWTANANIATVKNKVISLGRSNRPIISDGGVPGTHITEVGKPIGSYYGYQVLGIFKDQADLDIYPSLSDTHIGDFKFEDVDGNGSITADDRTIIGDFFPDYTFGFSSQLAYKNFDLSFVVQGSQNFEVFHLAQRYLGSLQTFSNYRADTYANAYISAENPGNGNMHRPNAAPTGDNDAVSSYYVEDGSYVRVRNITLGYNFKNIIPATSGIKNLRIYFTTNNPWTFTNYPGYNPEVNMRPEDPLSQGEDYGTYPLAKSFVFGLNLGF